MCIMACIHSLHLRYRMHSFWLHDLQAVGLAIYDGVNKFLDAEQPVVLHRQARWHGINPVTDKLDP